MSGMRKTKTSSLWVKMLVSIVVTSGTSVGMLAGFGEKRVQDAPVRGSYR